MRRLHRKREGDCVFACHPRLGTVFVIGGGGGGGDKLSTVRNLLPRWTALQMN